MKNLKNNEETTIIGGTEMKKKDVAYILPVAFLIVGFLYGSAGFGPGWTIFFIGLILILIVAGNNMVR